MKLQILVVAGDGIGPEVTGEAIKILQTVAELGGHEREVAADTGVVPRGALVERGLPGDLHQVGEEAHRPQQLAHDRRPGKAMAMRSGSDEPRAHRARRITGTSPAHDTRFFSSKAT